MRVTVRVTLGSTHCNPYAIGRSAIKPQDLEANRTKVGLFGIQFALRRTKIFNLVRQGRSILVPLAESKIDPRKLP